MCGWASLHFHCTAAFGYSWVSRRGKEGGGGGEKAILSQVGGYPSIPPSLHPATAHSAVPMGHGKKEERERERILLSPHKEREEGRKENPKLMPPL